MEPYEGTEPYIFMSYARKDWERVKPFLDALSNAGYRLWWDKGISAGADWLDTLLEKVEKCAVFCPLFSEAFKDSYYCSEETKWAYRKKKTIVPLHLEKMTPDGLPRLYELLQGRQDLRLYEYADAEQFAERLGREKAFESCKVPEWHKVGQIQWRLSTDGVLTIAKNDFSHWPFASISAYQYDPLHQGSTAPWMPYREKILSVAIEDNIDVIGECAFCDCANLTNVHIPDSVTKIGVNTFAKCASLTNVRIPERVTSIGDGAFQYCVSLTNVRIPQNVTQIGKFVFHSCHSLIDVRISNSVTEIGDGAFEDCKSLTNVCIPDSVTQIGYWAFSFCESLKSVEIPAGAEVGQHAFPEHTRVIRRDAP